MSTTELTETAKPANPTIGPRRSSAGRASGLQGKLAVNGLLIVGVAYTVLPTVWLMVAATQSASAIFSGSGLTTDLSLTENVTTLLETGDGIYVRWYLNSLLYAGVGAGLGSLICVAAGYAFEHLHLPAKRFLYAFVLVGVLIPNTALALPMYLLASETGMVNTYWAVLLPVLTFPFGVYLCRVFAGGYVPHEVVEASRIDGASEFAIFRNVALPMMRSAFVTVMLFMFVGIWNNFFLPLVMLSDSDLYPLSLGIYIWNTQLTAQPERIILVMAGSVLAIIPLVVAFLGLQRFWKAGMTAGSVK